MIFGINSLERDHAGVRSTAFTGFESLRDAEVSTSLASSARACPSIASLSSPCFEKQPEEVVDIGHALGVRDLDRSHGMDRGYRIDSRRAERGGSGSCVSSRASLVSDSSGINQSSTHGRLPFILTLEPCNEKAHFARRRLHARSRRVRCAPVVHAGLLSPSQASTLIQSTASDTDALLLSLFYGVEAGQTLNYSSSLTATSWSGTLSGTYTGMGLSLSYLGDLSNDPSGPVTWTSSGSYGNQVWSGNGSATIGDTSSTTFLVGLSYAMTVGSHSASIVYQIPGTVRPSGAIMYGGPAIERPDRVSLNLDGANHPDSMKFSLNEF